MTLADLIQIASDERIDPSDITLVFQADPFSDTERVTLLDDPSRGTDDEMAHVFILTTEGAL